MELCYEDDEECKVITNVFNELTSGGDQQKSNFAENMKSAKYWACLGQIESSYSGIGKGRFAQRFAQYASVKTTPDYIKEAIEYICKKVDETNGVQIPDKA